MDQMTRASAAQCAVGLQGYQHHGYGQLGATNTQSDITIGVKIEAQIAHHLAAIKQLETIREKCPALLEMTSVDLRAILGY